MKSEELAWKVRKHILDMIHDSHAAHIAAALSIVDILAVLYADVLRINPQDCKQPERDRFVLSKGHAGTALYATLAEMGFFPVDVLKSYYTNGSILSGHVSHKVPGVEISTGSLGHGAAVACGMALAAKCTHQLYHVYTLVGDGECDEGIIWETALIANQYHLDNFTVIIDRNGLQAMGRSEDILQLEPFAEKWRSFGWDVIELSNGNDHSQLRQVFTVTPNGHPQCIIAQTTKGKGISFMENELIWHYRDPQGDFYNRAVAELEESKA